MLHVSYSALSAWRQCHQRWSYRYRHSIAPIVQNTKMLTGSVFHAALSDYLCLALDQRTRVAFGSFIENRIAQSSFTGEQEREQKPLLLAMASAYYKAFGQDAEIPELVRGVTSERVCAMPITPGVVLDGVTDGLTERNGEKWVIEHKTGSAPDVPYYGLLDEQATLYCLALDAVGVIYNFISQPRSREISHAERLIMPRTSHEIELSRTDAILTATELLRTPLIGRSRGYQCSWCDYRLLCIAALTGANEQEVIAGKYKQVQPEWERLEERG